MSESLAENELARLGSEIEPYARQGRSGLLPALHTAQRLHGWLSEPVVEEVARILRVPLADVHGVIEFYTLFHNKAVGKRIISVCTDIACALRGADGVLEHLCSSHRVKAGETATDGSVTVQSSPCLGLCEQAPAALVDGQAETSIDLGRNHFELGGPRSIVGGSIRLLTANCGHGSATLERHGEYLALRKALTMKPAEIVAEIKSAGLVGRGGAAFPTGIKWEGAASAEGSPKYVVCNADESEPGTFKDRVLLLDDPHTLIEGMLITGYAIGAGQGYIYLRGEYPYILPVLEEALAEARTAGWLGADIQGSGFAFDIEVRLGAGAYICGEETALFESIEGKRGFPRVKPPFPTTYGLFGKPTVINNVETLFNVPLIIQRGASEYRAIGTEQSPGPKLFCLSGDVLRPGVYEIPFGVTLRELLEMAGGMAGDKSLKAVLFGGAAGSFATAAAPGRPADIRGSPCRWSATWLRRGHGFRREPGSARCAFPAWALLCARIVRQMLPVPAWDAAAKRGPGSGRGRESTSGRCRATPGRGLDDDRCEPVRTGPDCRHSRALGHQAVAGAI